MSPVHAAVTVGRTSPIRQPRLPRAKRNRSRKRTESVQRLGISTPSAEYSSDPLAPLQRGAALVCTAREEPVLISSTRVLPASGQIEVPVELCEAHGFAWEANPCASLAVEVVEEQLALLRQAQRAAHAAGWSMDHGGLPFIPTVLSAREPLANDAVPDGGEVSLHPATAPATELQAPPSEAGDFDDDGGERLGMGADSSDSGMGEGGEGDEATRQPYRLPADHVALCGCGCGGVSATTLERAGERRTPPAASLYRPASDLASWLLPSSVDDQALLDAAVAEAEAATLDDQMVLEGGCGPARVRLLEHPEYPSCVRFATSCCHGAEGDDAVSLESYGKGEFQVAEFEAMRRMPPAFYRLGERKWRKMRHKLSPECRARPPDMCMAQRYEQRRGPRGAFMDFHTDIRPMRAGQRVASRGDVLGVSAGADMNFWYGASCGGADVAKERHAVRLHDGDTWAWLCDDDLANKHGVWFLSRKCGEPRDGVRWAFMFRWSNGRRRAFAREYPHRIVLTADERTAIAEQRAKAAVSREHKACTPNSMHSMSKRARVHVGITE